MKKIVKNVLAGCLVVFVGQTSAGHHEEKESSALPMALWSTYTIPAGDRSQQLSQA